MWGSARSADQRVARQFVCVSHHQRVSRQVEVFDILIHIREDVSAQIAFQQHLYSHKTYPNAGGGCLPCELCSSARCFAAEAWYPSLSLANGLGS